MSGKKRVLLKLTGAAFLSENNKTTSSATISALAQQIKKLQTDYQFGIVVGGGNFFRGEEQGNQLEVTPSVGHYVGMLATMMNGLILQDIFRQQEIQASLFSSVECPIVAQSCNPEKIELALKRKHVLIFSGGTGAPFFTTDTNAIVKALQIGASEVWKATDVDGIYDQNPMKNPGAKKIKTLNYHEAFEKNIEVMDWTAFTLAHKHQLVIRVFNIFEKDALLHAAQQTTFGSKIS